MDIGTAIKKPFTDIKKFLIGTVLGIIPIINFFAMGFALECSGLGRNKKRPDMPEWDEWGDYFVKGLLAFIVSALYALPGVLIVIFTIGVAAFSGMFSGGMTDVFRTMLSFGPFILLGILLVLLGAYLSGAAVLNYLATRNFGKAFAFGTVFGKAFTGAYFSAWLVGFVISVIVSIVFGIIPLIGGAIAGFATGVFFYSLLGEAYASVK